jgi:heptosyltransferase III
MAPRGNKLLKLVDRFVGIPLVAPFGLLPKRARPDVSTIKRIGLLKSAAIGDTLLLAGLFDAVRRGIPGARVVAITGSDNLEAAQLLPDRADAHVIVSPRAPLKSMRAVRRARLDVIVDFGSWPRFDAWLAATSGARYRIGFRTPGQSRDAVFDAVMDHSRDLHERDNYRRLVSLIGAVADAPPHIQPPGVLRPSQLPATPYVVFHAWSSGYMHEVKEWQPNRWAELAGHAARRGWNVVLTGSPRERVKNDVLARSLRAAGAHVDNIAGSYTLAELADVLVASVAVVSVNTGVVHLAALSGARTISLEGPVPPLRWGPIGPRVRSVVTTLPDCGYLHLGFEYAGQRLDCMDGVHVDDVLKAIDELLAEST